MSDQLIHLICGDCKGEGHCNIWNAKKEKKEWGVCPKCEGSGYVVVGFIGPVQKPVKVVEKEVHKKEVYRAK